MLAGMAAPEPSALDSPVPVTSSDGLTVAAYDLGGDGPDVLLVHATGFCAGVWAPVVEHLDGFRVAALDVRGHGRSDAPEVEPTNGMSWAGTAADVLAVVDGLGLERPVGVGHSMGGASLLIAELDRPGTFRGVWAFEPIVMPPEVAAGGSNPLAEGARRRRRTFESRQAAYDNFASKPPFAALDPSALAAYVRDGFAEAEDGSVSLRCRPEVEAATYEMGSQHHTFERLGGIDTEVTVVRGREDPFSPAVFAPAVAEAIPRGTLEDHPDLGHFGPLEDPAAIAASIRAAAGRVTR